MRCPSCHVEDPAVLALHREMVLTSYPVLLDDIGGTAIAGIDGPAEEREVLVSLNDDEPTFRCVLCGHQTDNADDFLDPNDESC